MTIIARTTRMLASTAIVTVLALSLTVPVTAADKPVSSESSMSKRAAADRVEARISELHAKLHINASQAPQWHDFAAVMRGNAGEIRTLLVAKSQSTMSMSAVDDLTSYRQLAQAHVDGLGKLIPAFQALYDTMSDHQKKVADTLFAQPKHRDMRSSSN